MDSRRCDFSLECMGIKIVSNLISSVDVNATL